MLDTMSIQSVETDTGAVTLMDRIRETLALWHRRTRERDQLALLTDRDLHDAGLTTSDVWLETRKPFWRD